MYRIVVPRKHRKRVNKVIADYNKLNHPKEIKSLKDYVRRLKIGCEDGWIKTNNKKYKSIVWMYENIELLEEYSND